MIDDRQPGAARSGVTQRAACCRRLRSTRRARIHRPRATKAARGGQVLRDVALQMFLQNAHLRSRLQILRVGVRRKALVEGAKTTGSRRWTRVLACLPERVGLLTRRASPARRGASNVLAER